MGGPPQPGEDQEVTVDLDGPEDGASDKEKDDFKKSFEQWKKDIAALREKYAKLKIKIRVSKIAYKKKDPDESF